MIDSNHGRRALRLSALALVIAATAACRPTGDFGRARPSFLNDTVVPVAGMGAGLLREEPVSFFNRTDDEGRLRDRAWAFVRAPHVRDWWYDALTEGQRTRILPLLDRGLLAGLPRAIDNPVFPFVPALARPGDPTRYYAFLRADRFASSESRWRRVIDDLTADALLVPPFCTVAARVRRVDVERVGVLNRQTSYDPGLVANALARVEENNTVMAWVWQSLAYRLESYRYAIDLLEVETPSDQLWSANRAYALLAGQRCDGAVPFAALDAGERRRSRLMNGPDPFGQPVLQK